MDEWRASFRYNSVKNAEWQLQRVVKLTRQGRKGAGRLENRIRGDVDGSGTWLADLRGERVAFANRDGNREPTESHDRVCKHPPEGK